jgi:nucleotide-binding universal stress UspA family protein
MVMIRREEAMTNIRSILVPVDFSKPSRAGVDLALELAKKFDAKITLLHVWGLPVYAFPEGAVFGPEVVTRLTGAAQDAVDRLKMEVSGKGVEVNAISTIGTPAEEIVERAKNGPFDLVVMGTHGRTGLTHVLLGSVAERVVRTAPCPVLTVRGAA